MISKVLVTVKYKMYMYMLYTGRLARFQQSLSIYSLADKII